MKTQDIKQISFPKKLVFVFIVAFAGGLLGALILLVVTGRLPLTREAKIDQIKKISVSENSAIIDLVKKVSPSVVSITSNASKVNVLGQTSETQIGAGTGMIVGENGLILTNKHVVEGGGDSFTVITSDGKEYSAKVLAKDPSADIAFLKIEANSLKPVELGDSSTVQVGQRVVAIGNALGQFQNTVTTGIISGIKRPIIASGGNTNESLSNLFQTDAAINPGNSGGPLTNIDGQVIGINTAVAGEGTQNIGFAIPINEAKNDIASVEATGKITKPYLGVHYIPLTKEIATKNKLPVNEGAYLVGSNNSPAILPGSPADKAGLADGDIIIKIDGVKIDKTNSLASAIGGFKINDKVKIIYIRGGKERTTEAKLTEKPED
ncbi:MAG: trypsin-like peptidase domain-containing protein [bacterium]|nr:trypsin-like peptidase domain-containing protein [bacterium]